MGVIPVTPKLSGRERGPRAPQQGTAQAAARKCKTIFQVMSIKSFQNFLLVINFCIGNAHAQNKT